MAGLVEQHGAETVYAAALAALGYPATFVTTINEARRIASQIQEN